MSEKTIELRNAFKELLRFQEMFGYERQYSPIVMLERAVKNSRPYRSGDAPRWVAVKDTFGYGSTTSCDLCSFFGLDPDGIVPGLECDCETY